ncbi:hypothetical protein BH24CHL10_BH24CHL10_04980 [soil metagenome]
MIADPTLPTGVASTDPCRSPSALVDAVAAEQTAVERAAIRLTAILVLGVYGALGLLASGAPAFGWLGRMPWWLPPAGITVLAAVIVAAMPIFLLRRDIVEAWIALTYLSRHGHDAWHRRYGEPLPDSASTDAWLASHPGMEHPIVRAQVLAMSGRADEARAALPAEDEPSDLFSRFLRAQVGWLAPSCSRIVQRANVNGDACTTSSASSPWAAGALDRTALAGRPAPRVLRSHLADHVCGDCRARVRVRCLLKLIAHVLVP